MYYYNGSIKIQQGRAVEIAAEMEIPVERVAEIQKIAQDPVSLETPIGEEDDSHLGDFIQDEETGMARVRDQAIVTVAGMIAAKTVKTTKTNQMMAFLTLEDLRGTLEVIVFPKDYEKYRAILSPDQKIFVKGRVSLGDEVQ